MPQLHAPKKAVLANLRSTARQPSTFWPIQPVNKETEDSVELRKSSICCFIVTAQSTLPDADQFSFLKALTEAVAQAHHGAAANQASLSVEDYQEAERDILR